MPKRMAKKKTPRAKASKKEVAEEVFKPPRPYIRVGLGLLVVIVLGFLGFNFFSNRIKKAEFPTETETKVEVEETVEETVAEDVTPTPEITGETYTVVPGDNLSEIAFRAYGDKNAWMKIAEANNLRNPDYIKAGTVLQIPR